MRLPSPGYSIYNDALVPVNELSTCSCYAYFCASMARHGETSAAKRTSTCPLIGDMVKTFALFKGKDLKQMIAPQDTRTHPEAEIAVIIPSYRSAQTLDRCLQSVTSQTIKQPYTVMVVHSGPEPLSEKTRQTFRTVTFCCFPERWLPGKARNWAVQRVQSPWIFFLDADCVVKPDWLETMLCQAQQTHADGVGGAVKNATPGQLRAWVMHILEFGEWLPGGRQRSCQNFPSCNALYRRAAFLSVGGFPEYIYPGEDTILNYRLRQHGYHLLFLPRCSAGHIHLRTVKALLQHNYVLGLTYGIGCRHYKLAGHFLLRFSRLGLLLLVPIRFLRIFSRLFPRHLLEALIFVIGFPLALLSLCAWALGFAEANKTKKDSGYSLGQAVETNR